MLKIITYFILLVIVSGCVITPPVTLFPLKKYDQNINNWVKPAGVDYNYSLIEAAVQKKHLEKYYNHYYATGPESLSPWSKDYVGKLLPDVYVEENKAIKRFNNNGLIDDERIGYGENFHPYKEQWIQTIATNMNIEQFSKPSRFQCCKRGIAVRNLQARILPTNDVHFHNFMLPGEGYPFDNLQMSSLWVGTPVYIIGQTLDKQWDLVLTPDFMAWVESDGVAKVSNKFVLLWQKQAKRKMVAIIRTNISVFDINRQYRFNAYIGAVFPGKCCNKRGCTILIPVADMWHKAHTVYAMVKHKDAVVMPLKATPHNFVTIMSMLLGRPYGWGNMYFYNDCSAELKNFYTPFGIWLPRHSSDQVGVGRMVDKNSLDVNERLAYLMKHGRKFTTIIYIGGHVLMYLGNYPNPDPCSEELSVALTYQNIWGLRPKNNSYRAVIGGSVLLPLLRRYKEDLRVVSLAGKEHFQVSYLDELPN